MLHMARFIRQFMSISGKGLGCANGQEHMEDTGQWLPEWYYRVLTSVKVCKQLKRLVLDKGALASQKNTLRPNPMLSPQRFFGCFVQGMKPSMKVYVIKIHSLSRLSLYSEPGKQIHNLSTTSMDHLDPMWSPTLPKEVMTRFVGMPRKHKLHKWWSDDTFHGSYCWWLKSCTSW